MTGIQPELGLGIKQGKSLRSASLPLVLVVWQSSACYNPFVTIRALQQVTTNVELYDELQEIVSRESDSIKAGDKAQ